MENVHFKTITPEEVHMVLVPRDQQGSEECHAAKQAELDKLQQFETYQEK